jgi:hypothetical protein
MLVVVPVSSHDSDLIEPFSKAICFFGIYKKHELLIVSRPSDKDLAEILFLKIKNQFKVSKIHIFKKNGKLGWPFGPNHYWKSTIEFLIKSKNKKPWYWMELDCTPVDENWLDKIDLEYKNCKTPFLGMIGNLSRRKKSDRNKYFLGCGVYPADIDVHFKEWRIVDQFNCVPFDLFCSYFFLKKASKSKLMKNCFRVSDFRCTNEGIRGINKVPYDSIYKYDSVIKKNIVVVHGCNDGSLSNLVCGGAEIYKTN